MTQPKLVDFDAVAPEKRQARIGGRVVDIGFIPARVLFDIARFKDDMDSGKFSTTEQITAMVELVARVTTRSDPAITAEWLLENASIQGLLDFCSWVMNPAAQKATEYEESQGNAETAKSPELSLAES
ncbi:MAG: hypothetical protein WC565_06365 [Parcubacteria group bacterium]|jgi:hypothetical protein